MSQEDRDKYKFPPIALDANTISMIPAVTQATIEIIPLTLPIIPTLMMLVILSVEEMRRKQIKEETIVNDDYLQKLVLVSCP